MSLHFCLVVSNVLVVVVGIDDVVVLDDFCLCCVGPWSLFWIIRLLFCMLGVSRSPKTNFPHWEKGLSAYGLLFVCLCSGFGIPFFSCLSCFFFSCFMLFLFLLFLFLAPAGIYILVSAFPLPNTILWRARGEKGVFEVFMFSACLLLLVCLSFILLWFHWLVSWCCCWLCAVSKPPDSTCTFTLPRIGLGFQASTLMKVTSSQLSRLSSLVAPCQGLQNVRGEEAYQREHPPEKFLGRLLGDWFLYTTSAGRCCPFAVFSASGV